MLNEACLHGPTDAATLYSVESTKGEDTTSVLDANFGTRAKTNFHARVV